MKLQFTLNARWKLNIYSEAFRSTPMWFTEKNFKNLCWYFHLKASSKAGEKAISEYGKGKINMNVINTWRHPNRCNQQHLIHHFKIFFLCASHLQFLIETRHFPKHFPLDFPWRSHFFLCELCFSFSFFIYSDKNYRIWIKKGLLRRIKAQ